VRNSILVHSQTRHCSRQTSDIITWALRLTTSAAVKWSAITCGAHMHTSAVCLQMRQLTVGPSHNLYTQHELGWYEPLYLLIADIFWCFQATNGTMYTYTYLLFVRFYSAMLFWQGICYHCVCPCITSRYCVEMTGWIDPFWGASFDLSYTVL